MMSPVLPPRSPRLRIFPHSRAEKIKVRLRLEALEDRTLLSSISGTVFNDLNGDGIQQSGELGLPGLEVDLQGPIAKGVLTKAGGDFSFGDLVPGNYTITEQVPTNSLLTSTPAKYTVTIPIDGGDVSGLLFGNFQFVSISGTVFNDLNGDGVQEPGESAPTQTRTVDLIRGQNKAHKTTDSNGNFIFVNVGPGGYTIQLEPQSGFARDLDFADPDFRPNFRARQQGQYHQ